MSKRWLPYILLGSIFFLALFLRVIDLPHMPHSLHQDELNAGYQGYKLLKTGSDLRGEFLPLYIDRFGDFRPAGIFYLDGISTMLLGLNTFAIRFPAALIGALTVFPVFLLAFLISKRKAIGYLAALFIAISPWHIVTSRATSEQIVALFLIICGVAFLLKGLEGKRTRWMVLSGISLLLSYFFYHTPRVFVPVYLTIFAALVLFHPFFQTVRKNIFNRRSLIILCVLTSVVTVCLTFTKSGVGRFSQTSIFSAQSTGDKIKALSDIDQNVTYARIFHNKADLYSKIFLDQYLSYFSMDFLFVKGGLPDRYVVPDMGLFYYIELPFLLLGFYFLLKKKDPFSVVPIIWLLVGPLAAAVTTEDVPNIQRALFMLPGFQILEAYGLYYLYRVIGSKKKILLTAIVIGGLIVNIAYFFHQYFVHSPSYVAYRRDDGTELLFQNLGGKEKDYQKVYLSSSQDLPLYYFYLHAASTKMAQYNQTNLDKGLSVGKYIFVHDECPERIIPLEKLKSSLIVDFGSCFFEESNLHEIDRIYRRDGTTAYILRAVK